MAEHERRTVAYLGPEASYTHQAALDSFPPNNTILTPQPTIAEIFTAVQNRTATRGVVPFENSSNGSVVFTLDLLANLHGLHPDIQVCGEAYVAVKHCLLGHAATAPETSTSSKVEIDGSVKDVAMPGCDLSKIKTVYSHPQAWGQCKAFLETHLKGVDRQDVSSTSRAAQLVSEDKSGETAALSSKAAAQVFGLDILAENINDRKGNTTRFLIIRNSSSDSSSPPPPPPTDPPNSTPSPNSYKSLITFTPPHSNPGSLAQCLSAFSSQGLNLTSIYTRPSGVQNWHYVFFVELQGRKEEGEEEGDVNRALGELDRVCRARRWLGSWRSGD